MPTESPRTPILLKSALVLITLGLLGIAVAGQGGYMKKGVDPARWAVILHHISVSSVLTALILASIHYTAVADVRLRSSGKAAAAVAAGLAAYLNLFPTIQWAPRFEWPCLFVVLGWPLPFGALFYEKTAVNTFQPDWSQAEVLWPFLVLDFGTALCLVLAAATIANAVSARLSSKKRTARTGLPGPEKT